MISLRLASLMSPRQWLLLAALTALIMVALPIAHLALPESHPLHVSAYTITVLGKFMCYAIVALGMDLIWGYAGILSLGQGLFFALGGYAMGMYLMRSIGRDGVYQSDLPDFMVFLNWKELPWYWTGSDQFWWAALLVRMNLVVHLRPHIHCRTVLGRTAPYQVLLRKLSYMVTMAQQLPQHQVQAMPFPAGVTGQQVVVEPIRVLQPMSR
jgi:hypothetical protein